VNTLPLSSLWANDIVDEHLNYIRIPAQSTIVNQAIPLYSIGH